VSGTGNNTVSNGPSTSRVGADWYRTLANSPIGGPLGQLGLPPAGSAAPLSALGQPLTDGPVAGRHRGPPVASPSTCWPCRGWTRVAEPGTGSGSGSGTGADGRTRHRIGRGARARLVLDATRAGQPWPSLGAAPQRFLTGALAAAAAVRGGSCCWPGCRSRPVTSRRAAARQSLDGAGSASVAKELRDGRPPRTLVQLDAGGPPPADVDSTVRFPAVRPVGLRGRPRSSGSARRARRPPRSRAARRTPAGVVLVTGAARGIGRGPSPRCFAPTTARHPWSAWTCPPQG